MKCPLLLCGPCGEYPGMLLFSFKYIPALLQVAVYLSRCGVQSNAELLAKGYPDIGWDPVEGERFLDFLQFTVWVNGKTHFNAFFE